MLEVLRPSRSYVNPDVDWTAELRRFARGGYLKAADTVEYDPHLAQNTITSQEFVEHGVNGARKRMRPPIARFLDLAASRAFPPPPEFKKLRLTAHYVCEEAVLGNMLWPNCGAEGRIEGGPWVVIDLDVGGHIWCPLGGALPYIEKHHPGLGTFISNALYGYLSISPIDYQGHVGAAFWCHEMDEEEAKSQYGEDYGGPTLKQFENTYPAWARKRIKISQRMLARELKRVRRVLDVDISDLFADGPVPRRRISRDDLCLYGQDPYYPGSFGWKSGDMLNAALDDIGNTAAQCDGQSTIAAVFSAKDIKSAAAKLSDAWRVLTTLEKFSEAIYSYRKRFKIA